MRTANREGATHASPSTGGAKEAERAGLIAAVSRGDELQSDAIELDERHQPPPRQRATLAPQDHCCWRLGDWMREGSTMAVSSFAGMLGGIATVLAVQLGTDDGLEDTSMWFAAAILMGMTGAPLLTYVVGECLVSTAEAVHVGSDRPNQAPAPSQAELV